MVIIYGYYISVMYLLQVCIISYIIVHCYVNCYVTPSGNLNEKRLPLIKSVY